MVAKLREILGEYRKNGFIFCTPGKIFLLLILIALAPECVSAAVTSDYTALKKFLTARMYSEAYLELLRCELQNKLEDPKLTKLKKDLLRSTRKEASGRAKVNPEDSGVYNVLADIDFQEGQMDNAVKNISKALEGTPTPLSHYIFAKILYCKGNVPQSFEQMEKALQADPSCEVIFEDFQFLYNCKNYGVASAKRLSSNAGFLRRATPVAADAGLPKPPDSPFDNDPTQMSDPLTSPEPEPDQLVVEPQPPDSNPITSTGTKINPSKDPTGTSHDVNPSLGKPPELVKPPDVEPPPKITIASGSGEPVEVSEDPEKKKIKEAEYWFGQAKKKVEFKEYDDAETTLKKAVGIFSGLPGIEDLQKTIDAKKKIDKDFQFAVSLYGNEKYDLALDSFLKAYEENPEKYAEATFYLGKIYLLSSRKDLKKARQYFDLFMKHPRADPELKRDVEWVLIGILTDDGEYEEAYTKFNEFVEKESEYAKNQRSYWKLKYTLWYHNYTTEIWIGLGIFLAAFVLVFILMVAPSLQIFVFDPVKRTLVAFEAKNYDRAVKVAEESLRRTKHPIQVQRQLIEVCIQAHFILKNYFKCQEHAKHLLTLFADNAVAWKYLSKSFLETNNSTDEAIAMYEEMYKKDPENKDYLPILAKFYAQQKQFTIEAMEIMYAYFQTDPGNKDNVLALAEAYIQHKKMGDEAITVLLEALKHGAGTSGFRELLARNYSKKGLYPEAVRECLKVLESNINNMGIHVVYTSCMKKMNMVDEAILQYEDFLKKNPTNPQLMEILTGLRKEVEQAGGPVGVLPGSELMTPFSEEILPEEIEGLQATDLADPQIQADIEGFVEPPPEDFESAEKTVPIPDFMKAGNNAVSSSQSLPKNTTAPTRQSKTTSAKPVSADDEILDIPTMDPFSEQGLEALEPDLIIPTSPIPSDSRSEKVGDVKPSSITEKKVVSATSIIPPVTEMPIVVSPTVEKSSSDASGASFRISDATGNALNEAKKKAVLKKWDDAVAILSGSFATKRSKPVGMALADAYLQLKKPALAKEIIDTLQFDKEMLDNEAKEILYRVGRALEEDGKIREALSMYDVICNVDINYQDAFDRSDQLYNKLKQKN